jgi:hypothetical protein
MVVKLRHAPPEGFVAEVPPETLTGTPPARAIYLPEVTNAIGVEKL